MKDGVHRGLPPALNAGAEVAFVCDERGSILDASDLVGGLLGRSLESMRGQPLAQLVAPEHQAPASQGLAAARRSGTSTFSVNLLSNAGPPVPAAISAVAVEVPGKTLTLCLVATSNDARRRAEERARRLADTQKVIATILELALQDIPLEELLRQTLDLVLWIPWLCIERAGAIFLVDREPDALVMKVERGLCNALRSACSRVSFGTCLCGQAAATGKPVYAGSIDERHSTRYSGIAPHGHYCVPICSGGTTLGVLNTYLVSGHEPSAIELEFLMAVADTLAGVLIRRRADEERLSLRQRLEELGARGRAAASD